MHLELRLDGKGRLRRRWYGALQLNGRRRLVSLCRWTGTPPSSRKAVDPGDPAFEESRKKAADELQQFIDGERSVADQSALAERIHRARYGHTVQSVPLANLPKRWLAIPRKRKPTAFYIECNLRALQRFLDFMAGHAPRVKDLGAVTGDMVSAFFEARSDSGISAKTYNWELSLLRSLFARLDPYASAYRDYLKTAPTRTEDIVHRIPFTADELSRIFDAAAGNELLRPLIVCAACTAMRRGDVARLRWRHVSLAEGLITVKTSKTGASVEIPVFPPLRVELETARAQAPDAGPDAFVWPRAARMYEETPEALNRYLMPILVRAGFASLPADAPHLQLRPETDVRTRVEELIRGAPDWTDKRRAHALEIFRRYMDGATVPAVAASLGIVKGLVSQRLNELETLSGLNIVRRRLRADTVAPRDEAYQRVRRGSVRGWHSFRVTWITTALSAGVPMEIVRKVSGHAAVDVVLKHYFKPGQAEFRRTLQAAMPKLLTGGDRSAKEEALAILDGMTARTWKKDAARVRELLVGW